MPKPPLKAHELSDPVKAFIGLVIVILATPILIIPLYAGTTLLLDSMNWLKTGSWHSESLWDWASDWFGRRPFYDWVVPNKILQFVLDLPFWFPALVFCFGYWFLFRSITDWLDETFGQKAK